MLTATRGSSTAAKVPAGPEIATAVLCRRLDALQAHVMQPVDASSVAVFRILFGAVISTSSVRFLAKGWVEDLYLAPSTHVTYAGFEWIRPLSDSLMGEFKW